MRLDPFRIAIPIVLLLAACAPKSEHSRIDLFVGGGVAGAGPNFYATIDASGDVTMRRTSLPIVPPGKLTETKTAVRLSAAETKELFALAEGARDFAADCDTVADGTTARMTLIGATPTERVCSHTGVWPKGAHTKAFLDRLNVNLPREFRIE